MRTVVIVLFDPAGDAQLGLVKILVLVESHLLFFQAAMRGCANHPGLLIQSGHASNKKARSGESHSGRNCVA